MTDPFKHLGLNKATATEADVKSAYARLLKITRPEDDRAAFMELREAFSAARNIAKRKKARPVTTKTTETVTSTSKSETTEPEPPKPKPKPWRYVKALKWNVPNTPSGELIEKTLMWIENQGPDPDAFAAEISEILLTNADIDLPAFHTNVIEFILNKADTNSKHHSLNDWEMFELERPDWLTDSIMTTLANKVGIFNSRPTKAFNARDYNVALKLFESVIPKAGGFEPADSKGLFAKEQTRSRKDAHGSYFDTEQMTWVDESPVAKAMRDFEAATKKNIWGDLSIYKEILEREEVQPLDEFQMLDARLRQFICNAAGYHAKGSKFEQPSWLTKPVMLQLDKTFGWSRSFGRGDWERRQFDWLHKVIKWFENNNLPKPGHEPQAYVAPPITSRPPPKNSAPSFVSGIKSIFRLIYQYPGRILAAYLGARALQIFIAAAT